MISEPFLALSVLIYKDFGPYNQTLRVIMYQDCQRKSAKGYWLEAEEAAGQRKIWKGFQKTLYPIGPLLKSLMILALVAVSILIPPALLQSVSHPPRPLLQTLPPPWPSNASSPNLTASWQPGFLLHQEAEGINPALHAFPPPIF